MKKYSFRKGLKCGKGNGVEQLFFHYGNIIYDPSEYMISGEGEIHIWVSYANRDNRTDYEIRETGIYLNVDMNTLLKDIKGEMEK